jgi:hypothetical protein
MGLDASRDDVTIPARLASNRSNTDTNPSNFTGECCVAICGIDSQCVKIGLTYLTTFVSQMSELGLEREDRTAE